jgi:hypothetical protein
MHQQIHHYESPRKDRGNTGWVNIAGHGSPGVVLGVVWRRFLFSFHVRHDHKRASFPVIDASAGQRGKQQLRINTEEAQLPDGLPRSPINVNPSIPPVLSRCLDGDRLHGLCNALGEIERLLVRQEIPSIPGRRSRAHPELRLELREKSVHRNVHCR